MVIDDANKSRSQPITAGLSVQRDTSRLHLYSSDLFLFLRLTSSDFLNAFLLMRKPNTRGTYLSASLTGLISGYVKKKR